MGKNHKLREKSSGRRSARDGRLTEHGNNGEQGAAVADVGVDFHGSPHRVSGPERPGRQYGAADVGGHVLVGGEGLREC